MRRPIHRRRIGARMSAVLLGLLLGCCAEQEPSSDALIAYTPDWQKMWREPIGTWTNVADAQLAVDPSRLQPTLESGYGTLINSVSGERTSNLISVKEYGDIEAHIEFMVAAGSNSGVYFMGRYEIQIFDSYGVDSPGYYDCGGIYQRWDPSRGKGEEGFEGRPPLVNAVRPPGFWNNLDVIFRAPRFDASGNKIENARFVKVTLNRKVIHENQEVSGPTRSATFDDEQPTGPLMLQGDHGPVAYREIIIRPLDAPPSP